VTGPARRTGSVGGDERLRLFFGLRLPEEAAAALAGWAAGSLAGGGRLVAEEHLHVTLAFLGARPAAELAALRQALVDTAGRAGVPELAVSRYRETRSVGMLVLDDDGGRATDFALELQAELERIGVYRPEGRPWLPHVTVLRFRERPRLTPSPPALAPFSPSDAALYHSVLRPSGAQYRVIEAASLGG
jgi:2'-5' RNA ligase